MNENNITKHKSVQTIYDRISFRVNRYPLTIFFKYNSKEEYQLQNNIIQLEENEHPIMEDYNLNGILVLTTHYLYSIILNDKESLLLRKNQINKVAINDIIYHSSISEIIEEKERRKDYTEIVLKSIQTTQQQEVFYYIRTNYEFQFHESLRQLVCMNNFYKRQ